MRRRDFLFNTSVGVAGALYMPKLLLQNDTILGHNQKRSALGILTRAAPQLNLFAIGFPITLSVGLVGVLLTLPMMQAPFTMALERMLQHFQ